MSRKQNGNRPILLNPNRRATDETPQPIPQQEPSENTGDGEQKANVGNPFRVKQLAAQSRQRSAALGRRTHTIDTARGHVIRSTIPTEPIKRFGDVALIPTLRAAALNNRPPEHRIPNTEYRIPVTKHHLRRKIRASKTSNLILFVVDASGSMAARQRMVAVKGAIMSLLIDAYQKRDQVGMIAFRGNAAQLVLPPTNSAELAQRHLQQLPTGGRTPLAHALHLASQTLARHQNKQVIPLLVLVSDCRANVPMRADSNLLAAQTEVLQLAQQLAEQRVSSIVVETGGKRGRGKFAQQVAQALEGEWLQLAGLSAETLTTKIKQSRR